MVVGGDDKMLYSSKSPSKSSTFIVIDLYIILPSAERRITPYVPASSFRLGVNDTVFPVANVSDSSSISGIDEIFDKRLRK